MSSLTPQRRRDLPLVSLFTLAVFLPFLGKPYTMDEPLFLAVARHILQDPLHPLGFFFNWGGAALPMSAINNTPPLFLYTLAFALKITGGAAWAMRLLWLPVELSIAWGLYLIAEQFLNKPLLPVLIALACPACLINFGLLYPEVLAFALALWALLCLILGLDAAGERQRWFLHLSAMLLGLAVLSKYAAIVFLAPALGWSLKNKVGPRTIALYILIALAGPGLFFLHDLLHGSSALAAASAMLRAAGRAPTAVWSHRLRSLLAFAGGCGIVTAVWPMAVRSLRPKPAFAAASFILIAILFSKPLDLAAQVSASDRVAGFLWALGGAWGLWTVVAAGRRRVKGWALWAPWALSVLLLELFAYWSVIARIMALAVPAVVFALAEILEAAMPAPKLAKFHAWSLGGLAALSLALACVDYSFAQGEEQSARAVAARFAAHGSEPEHGIWTPAHWGLQYYLEENGARELDLLRGGWNETNPGDIVVTALTAASEPRLNRPGRPDASLIGELVVNSAIPLRLMNGGPGQAGFYSSAYGFLPFAWSREPLEDLAIYEITPRPAAPSKPRDRRE